MKTRIYGKIYHVKEWEILTSQRCKLSFKLTDTFSRISIKNNLETLQIDSEMYREG